MLVDLMLVVIGAFLWAIYAVLKSCLVELKQIRERLDVTNGLHANFGDRAAILGMTVDEIGGKVHSIEAATNAFHEQMLRAQSRH